MSTHQLDKRQNESTPREAHAYSGLMMEKTLKVAELTEMYDQVNTAQMRGESVASTPKNR